MTNLADITARDKLAIFVFFGVLGASLLILLLIYRCAGKFLHGDYIHAEDTADQSFLEEAKEEEDGWNSIEIHVQNEDGKEAETKIESGDENKDWVINGSVVENIYKDELIAQKLGSLRVLGSEVSDSPTFYTNSSDHRSENGSHKSIDSNNQMWPVSTVLKFPQPDFSLSVGSVATISLLLEQKPALKRLYGCIQAIHHVRMREPPDLVCFHVKITPQCKPRTRSEWRAFHSDPLDLDFSLRPLRDTMDESSSVCIRMYGKKQKSGISKERCCGEGFVSVSKLMKSGGVLNVDLQLTPKPM